MSWPLLAQAPSQALKFEVAFVKRIETGFFKKGPETRTGCFGGPGTPQPQRLTCKSTTLSRLIRDAYELKA